MVVSEQSDLPYITCASSQHCTSWSQRQVFPWTHVREAASCQPTPMYYGMLAHSENLVICMGGARNVGIALWGKCVGRSKC